ncbi:response regulator [Arcicella rosea]|uniref:CheY-like chemotaxis protein n=1 Tax=Arcicella rosea TaxID=502909 RepID=A0A841ECY1_9BACT|nr:response regulator [Arcicella rosea]MBB6001987.1 CheY-like chemotaxis protein [Arcicella rosea]
MNKRYNILIADDDDDDKFLVKSALEDCTSNTPVHFVENGVEVLEYLKNEGQFADKYAFSKPSVIILDLNMPKKDGRETLKEIKENPLFKKIPVIILTTSKAEEDVNLCYSYGANAYIVKPNSFTELTEILSTMTNFWLNIVTLAPTIG